VNYRTAFRTTQVELRFPKVLRRLLFDREGTQLLELALVLPFLAVMVVGILDFGQVYNLKQKLNNAAREAGRFAVGENSGANNLTTSDVTAVRDVVSSYLTSAGVTQCAIAAAPTVSGTIYTFTSNSAGCTGNKFSLVIDRGFIMTIGTTKVVGTHVTVTYPYTWSLGNVIGLILPGSTLSLPTTISTDTIMQNIN
jgi:Flp pilus assembly protein TadG